MTRLPYLLFFALFATGCVSAKGFLKRGMEAEAEQRYEQAARYYIEALQKDESLREARGRLGIVGPLALKAMWAESDALAGGEDYDRAIDKLDALQSLAHAAAAVGTPLTIPGDVIARRDELQTRAIERRFTLGAQAESLGQWERALHHYRDPLDRYHPNEATVARLYAAQFRVLVRWAEALASEGRFRAAYARAEEALAVPGIPEKKPALAVQQRALHEGTYGIAPLSLLTAEDVDPPGAFLTELNDLLDDEFWANPPLFLEAAEPAAVRRALREELRGRGYDRDQLTTSAAAEVGRAVDADFVVLPQLTTLSWEETDVKEERRSVRTREGRDTTFTIRSLTLRLTGEVEYLVVDAASRRITLEHTASARVEQPLRYAVYLGDARTLTLSREQRALFNPDLVGDVEQKLLRELRPALAGEFTRRVFDQLLQRIP